MIVLHEVGAQAQFLQLTLVVAFVELTALVAEYPGLDDQHFGQRGTDELHVCAGER